MLDDGVSVDKDHEAIFVHQIVDYTRFDPGVGVVNHAGGMEVLVVVSMNLSFTPLASSSRVSHDFFFFLLKFMSRGLHK